MMKKLFVPMRILKDMITGYDGGLLPELTQYKIIIDVYRVDENTAKLKGKLRHDYIPNKILFTNKYLTK